MTRLANELNFLPRLMMRDIAKEAYHFHLTHALTLSKTIQGVFYQCEVDTELNTVFIRFNAPNGDRKVSVHKIGKTWN